MTLIYKRKLSATALKFQRPRYVTTLTYQKTSVRNSVRLTMTLVCNQFKTMLFGLSSRITQKLHQHHRAKRMKEHQIEEKVGERTLGAKTPAFPTVSRSLWPNWVSLGPNAMLRNTNAHNYHGHRDTKGQRLSGCCIMSHHLLQKYKVLHHPVDIYSWWRDPTCRVLIIHYLYLKRKYKSHLYPMLLNPPRLSRTAWYDTISPAGWVVFMTNHSRRMYYDW